jgi:hypothetical protein
MNTFIHSGIFNRPETETVWACVVIVKNNIANSNAVSFDIQLDW